MLSIQIHTIKKHFAKKKKRKKKEIPHRKLPNWTKALSCQLIFVLVEMLPILLQKTCFAPRLMWACWRNCLPIHWHKHCSRINSPTSHTIYLSLSYLLTWVSSTALACECRTCNYITSRFSNRACLRWWATNRRLNYFCTSIQNTTCEVHCTKTDPAFSFQW